MAEKEVVVRRGPRFFLADDGVTMFEHVIDSSNSIGPRPATDEDKAKHATAYAAFEARETAPEPVVADDAPAPQANQFLEIPDDWRDDDAAGRKNLASALANRQIGTAAEADMIIRAEVERREAEAEQNT